MPSNSEYARRQFRAQADEQAEKEQLRQEVGALRRKVKALEDKVARLTHEISRRKVVVENPRGFS
ncbi:MAG TPA: hypothetical protein VN419_07385 [Humidesulfovibrio sp.]|uniref:hypothetical protein n=1 Tax=Humidesulfovibrio sp. TaxID=2910988 RepID=UPI002C5809BE|nr:hypothetical protein [Humidesulfovibrio sp.]HWR03827.1 hypothetical protein [Humidesulfovibrio sp.]